MEVAGNTPVLVSASQVVDRLDENWKKLGPADMAAKAVSEMLASPAVRLTAHPHRVPDLWVAPTRRPIRRIAPPLR